jgi:hypothetical protein
MMPLSRSAMLWNMSGAKSSTSIDYGLRGRIQEIAARLRCIQRSRSSNTGPGTLLFASTHAKLFDIPCLRGLKPFSDFGK